MASIPSPVDRLLSGLSWLPRVGRSDGRAIEDALGDATLFEERVPLGGAVLEAAYAATDPPVARRLRSEHVPLVLDLHSLRFAGDGFLAVERIANLSYAPNAPLAPADITETAARGLAASTARFSQEAFAATYTVPGLPLRDKQLDAWITANRRLTEAACSLNGVTELERKPVIALVAPGRKAMASPELVLDWLVDLPVAAVYLQPLNFQPARESAEKLAAYIAYIQACQEVGIPVMCGRLGAFGLVVQALIGASAFDSGLGDAEGFTFSSQQSQPRRGKEGASDGGGNRRIYFEPLKTTLEGKHALPLLEQPSVRSRLTCKLGCCRFRGFEDLAARRRPHYLRTRVAEVQALASRPEPLRVTAMAEELTTAREHARVVRRALLAAQVSPPSFEHLDRWLGLLASGEQLRLTG